MKPRPRPPSPEAPHRMHPQWIDYAVLFVYACFVLGIGLALKKNVRNSDEFFIAGRRIPGWITGLAFLSANLGALEVMGMAANGAKCTMKGLVPWCTSDEGPGELGERGKMS